MFGSDMTIDNGVEEEEEEWAPTTTQTTSLFVQPQPFPQNAFASQPTFGSSFGSTTTWQFPSFSPLSQTPFHPDTSTTTSFSNPFFASSAPSLGATTADTNFSTTTSSSFLSSSHAFGADASVSVHGKRKRRDRDSMTDEGPTSPLSERAQVKVVSKRLRLMKPFVSPPFLNEEKAEVLKSKNSSVESLSIKVKTLSGKVMSLMVDPQDTIQDIKEYLEEKSGVPVVQQRIIFRGKQVADTKTLAEYNIETGSVLHLVLALRGGCVGTGGDVI